MIQLTYGNSFSKVEGLKTEHFNALKKLLSYNPDAQSTYITGRPPVRKFLIDKHGSFPSGLISRVCQFLDSKKIAYHLGDGRPRHSTPPKATKFNGKWEFPPYQWQVDAVKRADENGRGCISAPTGTGKSRAIAMIIQEFQVKTLIIVPSLEIKKQLASDLLEVFGSLKNIDIENVDAKKLKTPGDYGLLLIDEAHHVAAKTYRDLNAKSWVNIPYRFFLTATPFRNNPEETLLFESIAGDLIYQLTYKEAIAKKYIVPVDSYFYTLPKRMVQGITYAQVYKELVVENQERNLLIADVALQLNELGKSTLVLVKEVKHGEALAALTGLPFVNGQDEESREYIGQFNREEIKVLIGTMGVVSEGVDTKPCEYVVVAGLGKAKSAFMQLVGRSVRRYKTKETGKVILFNDKSHKWTSAHYKAQAAILLEEYGAIPNELER